MNIGGYEFPTWALGVAGVAVAVLVLRNKSAGTTQQTDTSTGLLAAEVDQRMQEQWQAWKDWLEQYLNDHQGPVTPPNGDVICTPCPGNPGTSTCVGEGVFTGPCPPDRGQDPGTCRDGYYWNGHECTKPPVRLVGPPELVVPIGIEPVQDWTPTGFVNYPETPLVQPLQQPTELQVITNPVVFESV